MFVHPNTWESAHVFAPYVFRYRKKYAMIYTGLNDYGAQALGLAFSNDLFNTRSVNLLPACCEAGRQVAEIQQLAKV